MKTYLGGKALKSLQTIPFRILMVNEKCKYRGCDEDIWEKSDENLCIFHDPQLDKKNPEKIKKLVEKCRNKDEVNKIKRILYQNVEEVYCFLPPPISELMDFPIPKLRSLYQDCYQTLLIGRYNASIVLMGVLVEAICKERIKIKSGEDFQGPLGQCINKIESENWMKYKDIKFLRGFKDEIRNKYQHFDEFEILKGKFFEVYPLKFEKNLSPKKLKKFIKKIKTGEVKSSYVEAANIHGLRAPAKKTYDKYLAIALFDQIHFFLINSLIRYLSSEDYEEFHEKSENPLSEDLYYKL